MLIISQYAHCHRVIGDNIVSRQQILTYLFQLTVPVICVHLYDFVMYHLFLTSVLEVKPWLWHNIISYVVVIIIALPLLVLVLVVEALLCLLLALMTIKKDLVILTRGGNH